MATELAYINGQFTKLDEAKINALDRGFIYGDGLYEVIAVYGGRIYQLDEHLERYEQGAKEMLFENYPTSQELKEITKELLRKSSVKEGIVYLEVTRGTAPRQHSFPTPQQPNVFLFSKETPGPDSDKRNNGVKAILVPDERWNRCHVKSTNLLPNCFYKEKAKRADAFEAIQVRREGVTDGTSTNVFGVKNGVIYTTPATNKILNGITRRTVLSLANKLDIPVEEKYLLPAELYSCDEVFITSTTIKLLPINKLDEVEYPLSNYRITYLLQEELDKYILENSEKI